MNVCLCLAPQRAPLCFCDMWITITMTMCRTQHFFLQTRSSGSWAWRRGAKRKGIDTSIDPREKPDWLDVMDEPERISDSFIRPV